MAEVNDSERSRNWKNKKKTKKEKNKSMKVASIQESLDHQSGVREAAAGVGSSRGVDITDLRSNTAPLLDLPTSTPVTVDSTTHVSIPKIARTTDAENGAFSKAPILTLLELGPSLVRYVFAPFLYFIYHWG